MPESSTIIASRRRPLSTCGASALAVAQGLYIKALGLNGPIGSMTKRLAKLGSVASPVASMVLYNCLAVLACVDDHILLIENTVEAHFPSSSHVFNTIDDMVNKIEDFPNSMNKFPSMLHKIPFLDWGVIYAIKWLEFITSVLVVWGLDSAKEKEIRVDDTKCKEQTNQNLNKFSSPHSKESHHNSATKLSYKEALEKGVKNASLEHKYNDGKNDVKEIGAKDYDHEKDAGNWNDETKVPQMGDLIATSEDPLLDLFEFGWQAPKPKTSPPLMSRSNSQMSRSSSQMSRCNSQT